MAIVFRIYALQQFRTISHYLEIYYNDIMSPVLFKQRDYRGATVEDLDIKPAISINPSTLLDEALEISFEHEFSYLPVINESNKKLLGIFDVESVKNNKQHHPNQPTVSSTMLWFNQKARENYLKQMDAQQNQGTKLKTAPNSTIKKPQSKGKGYYIITPDTALEQLAEFFNSGVYFALITNGEGTIVYGVATPEDLEKFEKARPKL